MQDMGESLSGSKKLMNLVTG